MARGRHVRRSGLLARLWPGRRHSAARRLTTEAHLGFPTAYVPSYPTVPVPAPAPVVTPDPVLARLAELEGEVARLRVLGAQHAASAAAAEVRARRAEEQVAAVCAEIIGLRGDLAALREELVWAFAESRLPVAAPEAPEAAPAAVIDLRESSARTA